jgi:uncharacterized protein with ATP-grasp and redox domains
MRVRVPEILERAAAQQPRGSRREAEAIRRLRDEVVGDAAIRAIEGPAPDLDDWDEPVRRRAGERWLATDWFFAETYVYRRVIEAVRYWETDVDPFRATKEEELSDAATWERVERARELATARDSGDRIAQLLDAALWGNRMDLSYAAAVSHGTASTAADLLVDDRARALPRLLRAGACVDVIADNAGTELLVDLLLVHALIEGGVARVVLHVKAHPTFVSDATAADVRDAIARLGPHLAAASSAGRLRIEADSYWNSPRFIDEAPLRIRSALAEADLAIVKGDANYRRLIGDAEWDPATPPSRASGPLPCPMLALRTLKSDPIVGLPRELVTRLDRESPTWRVDGRRGVIQLFE